MKTKENRSIGMDRFTSELVQDYALFSDLKLLDLEQRTSDNVAFDLFARVSDALTDFATSCPASQLEALSAQTRARLSNFSTTFNSVLSNNHNNINVFKQILSNASLKSAISSHVLAEFTEESIAYLFNRSCRFRTEVLVFLGTDPALNRPFKDTNFIDFLIRVS